MINKKLLLSIVGFSLSLSVSPLVFASAYQSFEQNAAGLGESYAGAGSKAEDASVEFDNPAAMVVLKHPTMALSTVAVNAHSNFTATSATNAGGADILSTGKTKVHPLGTNYLPAFHLVMPLNNRTSIGFGVEVPFGLETNYPKDSAARYFGTHSQIETININPSIAFALNKQWSVGFGVDALYLKADLDQQIDAGFLRFGTTNRMYDASIDNVASDWGYGWNAGVLYQYSPHTRFGLSYRSKVSVKPTGKSKVTLPDTFNQFDKDILINRWNLKSGDVSTRITLPEMVILSGFHQFTNRWSLMGSVTYTRWDRFDYLTLHFDSGLPAASIHENFRNTFKYAVGTDFCVNQKLMLRAGAAYDESPVKSKFRTVSLPDANREWLSLGLRYAFTHAFSVDLGYAYVHINNGSLLQTNGQASIAGKYRSNYANLFGAQINWTFS